LITASDVGTVTPPTAVYKYKRTGHIKILLETTVGRREQMKFPVSFSDYSI
jgi:hypothetical protein